MKPVSAPGLATQALIRPTVPARRGRTARPMTTTASSKRIVEEDGHNPNLHLGGSPVCFGKHLHAGDRGNLD